MAHSRADENRSLTADEQKLVDKTRHPAVRELSDGELSDTIRLVRERRDRAQSEARRQKREMRGKAAPKGSRPATGNAGTVAKSDVLAMAVRRLNGERERRRA